MQRRDQDILASARRDLARQQLRALLVFFAVGITILFVIGLVLRESEVLYLTGVNFLLLAVISWLRSRDRLTEASFVAGLALVATATWCTATSRFGLLDSTVILFAVAVMYITLLLPHRPFVVALALAVAAILLVGFRGPLGLTSSEDAQLTLPIDVAVVAVTVVIMAFALRRQNSMLWDTLHRAVAHERDLAASHAELQRRQVQVEASEQRWRSLVTAAPDWIVQLERDGTIVFVNRDDTSMAILSAAKLTDLVVDEDRRQLADAIAAALGGTTGSVELNVNVGGVQRRCAFHVGPLEFEGRADGAIVLVSDVTERRRLQEQFLQTQKLDSIGQLAGGIAHDFNNMLTVIGGHADLAQLKLPQTDPALEDLEVILRTCDHATALTRQILAFSRRQPLRPEPVDLGAAIGKMRRMLERLIDEDIRLDDSLAGGLPLIEADPGSLEQVLMNLVVNARDAIRERSDTDDRSIVIATRLRRLDAERAGQLVGLEPGPYVELSVRDTGVGMDAELQSKALRALLHHQGGRPRHGAGSGHGLRHRDPERRHRAGGLRPRPGHDHPRPLAHHRTPDRGGAGTVARRRPSDG